MIDGLIGSLFGNSKLKNRLKKCLISGNTDRATFLYQGATYDLEAYTTLTKDSYNGTPRHIIKSLEKDLLKLDQKGKADTLDKIHLKALQEVLYEED